VPIKRHPRGQAVFYFLLPDLTCRVSPENFDELSRAIFEAGG